MLVVAALAACGLTFTAAAATRQPAPPQTTVAQAAPAAQGAADPFLWLENKTGARAMAWVRAQNARSLPVLEGDAHYQPFYAQALAIAQSNARIPSPRFLHGAIYNFWQDAEHVRGVWRRTTLASYRSEHPQWTTVLDLDALSGHEHANWVWKGYRCVEPQEDRCLISLSDGGEDAVTMREFDLTTDRFVPNGFVLPRQKQTAAWLGERSLLVSRAWTPGEETASGYAYDVRELERGQPLSAAKAIYKGQPSDVSVDPVTLVDGQGHSAAFIDRGVSFFSTEHYLLTPHGVEKVGIPMKVDIAGLINGELLLELNQDWKPAGTAFAQGSLVDVPLSEVYAEPAHLHPRTVYHPGSHEALDSVATTRHDLILTILDDVRGRAYAYSPSGSGWSRHPLALPDMSTIRVVDTNLQNDQVFVDATSFLTPTTLYLADAATSGAPATVKAMPAQFDASNDVVEQFWATSTDGTRIPYFIVHPKQMAMDGRHPTVINAYGGFLISSTPSYSGTIGKLWLEHGGVYVLANIRGGGEFGPAWHDAGLTIHRQRIYDDFYAVGRDLVARHITDPRHLGIVGGSNGGLLMGVELTEHPEMWNAVQIEVPLLDMLRYEKIEAGASWVGEYGSVSDPQVRAFWEKTSPYQNLKSGVAYPEPFIWTDTKDDRVGPEHARKFAAKLAAMHVPYLYYENTEGGHASGANLKESARTAALGWTYFTRKLVE
ncbi:MAG TPA: prolyl oligopeptidase family serine peptidase [Vicinamibacterales bacterium]